MEPVKVVCPSCFEPEITLDFSGDLSTCSHCQYVMQNMAFLNALATGSLIRIDGIYYRYSILVDSLPNKISKIAQIDTVTNGVSCIQDCVDLDKILPFVKKLQELWPDLELRVVNGISRNLRTCPLCGSTEFVLVGDGVKCKCEKLIVSVSTFVLSQVATAFRSINFRKDDYLELHETVIVNPKWWQIFAVSETVSTPIAKFHLRRKVGDDGTVSYILAVEVAGGTELLEETSLVLDKVNKSVGIKGVEVLQVKKIL